MSQFSPASENMGNGNASLLDFKKSTKKRWARGPGGKSQACFVIQASKSSVPAI